MAYNDRKIKVDSSQRDINDKVKNEIEDTEDKIYWYMKFNQPLDPNSISKKTMSVTETNGYIFDTKIIYNKNLELIVIEPLDIYKEEEYYILHIKKEVRSENMKNLKNDVHILFKVKGGQVSEFKELGENVIVPKPRKRPKADRKPTKSKVYLFEREGGKLSNNPGEVALPYLSIKFNTLIGIIGMPIFAIGIIMKNLMISGAGGIVALIGFIHILTQVTKNEFKSNFYYNIGVSRFNKEKYAKSKKSFKKALSLNINNEYAEYALNKVSFYL